MEEVFNALNKEFYEISVAKNGTWIKCAYIRGANILQGDRIGRDKHFIDVVDKISKEYKLDYKYVSNLRLIKFDLFKDGSLFDLYE